MACGTNRSCREYLKGHLMKKLRWSVLALALSVGAANASGNHEEAIHVALEGPEGAHTIAFNHRFAVQPPQMQDKRKSGYTLIGRLTRLGAKSSQDDVIDYRVVREKGAVKSIELQINDGVWLPVSERVMSALGGYRRGEPMPEEKQQEVTRALEKLVDSSWQRAAEFLIAHIAVRHC
jgi:hypothetical protein